MRIYLIKEYYCEYVFVYGVCVCVNNHSAHVDVRGLLWEFLPSI